MSLRRLGGAVLALLFLIAAGVGLVLNRRVDRALEVPSATEQPVEFTPVPERPALPFWGSEDVESVVALPGGLYASGGFGVARLVQSVSTPGRLRRVDISMPLPTRRASAMSAWRSDLVVGLDQEGLFVYRDGSWSEVRSGFGFLHVRALAEDAAGVLWVGAREGLFRLGYAERVMTRLHASPVRSVAVAEGGRVVSGGETGLFVTQGGATTSLTIKGLPLAWVEEVTVFHGRIHVVTPVGLFAEGRDGRIDEVPTGANVGSIAIITDRLFATADPPDTSLRRFDGDLRLQVERVPVAVRRVFDAGGRVLADTARGLAEFSSAGFRLVLERTGGSFGNAHVGALAVHRDRIVAGFFDGGLAELVPAPGADPPMMLREIGAPGVWATNALLDAGGVLHVASLRGAFRFDGQRVIPVEGSGAAFSLAGTRTGVAIGYGEGVLLPERRLLSAFHGLPGNQATALAATARGLLVGTPSGLGYVENSKVRWRVASGEGRLPHPWVTSILPSKEEDILVGTYGGGLVRRTGALSDVGEWRPFPETAGLKVNTGCLVAAKGRVYAGTDGAGLFRLSLDQTRFERLKLSLPSQRVTALVAKDDLLYIGTDEGLTRWSVERDVQR